MVAEGEQPVCRILDADRYRFEKSKQEREHARKQRALTIETKEIQLRPVTGENDLLTKAKKAKLFLETGDKVKITVRFRGREKTHKEEGHRIINHFIAEVGDYKIFKPLTEGESDLTIILASNVVKTEKRREKTHEVA
jgi:translation initiation factor IF-3